jgi:hypothetical protein
MITVSSLANRSTHGKLTLMRPLAVLFALSLSLAAQTGGALHDEGSTLPRRGTPGMSGGIRPPAGFEKLGEEERKLLREAFEKAWKDPKVVEARDQALRANENVRRALNETMGRDNPKIAALLAKMKPPFETDDRGFPILPRPDSPDFVKVAQARLGAEMMAIAKPGKQEDNRRFHERIMGLPRMREAMTTLESTPPAGRFEALRKIRELYRQVVTEEFARYRKNREEGNGAAGPAADSKAVIPKAP